MNIWQIADPVNFSIAYYYGSWTSRNFCEHCGRNGRDPILPTIVEWENENDEVGDFTHVKRSYCLLVKRNAYDAIISSLNSTGIRAETVTYHISAEARIRKEKQKQKIH